jgi:hypothetical protein
MKNKLYLIKLVTCACIFLFSLYTTGQNTSDLSSLTTPAK